MVPDIHAKFHNQQFIMRRAIQPFLALSTCFWDPSTTELCLWGDCATKKITFYTTHAVILLLRDSSIHRNSLQCCRMTQRRGKREQTKTLESYTINPNYSMLVTFSRMTDRQSTVLLLLPVSYVSALSPSVSIETVYNAAK